MQKRNFNLIKAITQYTSFFTITDIIFAKNTLQFSYNFIFSSRMHHVLTKEPFLLPEAIIKSFAFKHFRQQEQDFILSCNAYNEILSFLEKYPDSHISNFYTGNTLTIIAKNESIPNYSLKLHIADLAKFTSFFRKYKRLDETEKIIVMLLKQRD